MPQRKDNRKENASQTSALDGNRVKLHNESNEVGTIAAIIDVTKRNSGNIFALSGCITRHIHVRRFILKATNYRERCYLLTSQKLCKL